MMTVSVFNPEHDIALAEDSAGYVPPKAAQRLRKDLQWIASLWKEDGKVTVWGWDKAIVKELKQQGVPTEQLPTDEQLDAIRKLSNRSLAVEMLADLRDMDGTTGHSEVCYTLDDVMASKERFGDTIVKAPWSSSGRGVKEFTIHNSQFIVNTIAKQGTVIAEKKCDRVRDFAIEYSIDRHGEVNCKGLSLFDTSLGAYKGNMLLEEDEKLNILAGYVDKELIKQVSGRIKQFLSPRLKGSYEGPFGVDMMICRSADGYLLNPCVEINLRRTMGHVALALTSQGHRGTMSVLYNKEKDKYELKY
ncbi:MAG: hypothetical protein IJV10_02620 [Prevotella sp.]|nr:hypothetical protein [Prevotella sp.]